mmetsp:Transcript_19329/g.42056  ORF Transcript_19329/g.42056 Transcript_19329/m.42056 type:complete len:105 (+) Transcript_19329:114-428(+)
MDVLTKVKLTNQPVTNMTDMDLQAGTKITIMAAEDGSMNNRIPICGAKTPPRREGTESSRKIQSQSSRPLQDKCLQPNVSIWFEKALGAANEGLKFPPSLPDQG